MLTVGDVAEATRGTLDRVDRGGDWVTGVSIDSRTVTSGDLFVAFPGERVDGHAFVGAAATAGAAAVLVHDAGRARSTLPPSSAVPMIEVADTSTALVRLAQGCHRMLVDGGTRTVAITGSAGKTTTKDLLAHLLAGHPAVPDSVVAPPGSYNNEIGLPLTVVRAGTLRDPPAFLVLEMGARGEGHIARLCRIARPDVSVVLMVGSAHLSEFGSREGIARAKGEIVEALDATGVAVLNGDDPLVMTMASRTAARVVTFGIGTGDTRGVGPAGGTAPAADVAAADVTLDARARPGFVLRALDGRAPVGLPLEGEHQVVNALAAAAVGLVLGMDVATVADRLSTPGRRSPHRMAVWDRPDGITVLDDAYNASPEATAAALRSLAVVGRGRRTWAVLGPMLELGAAGREEHERVGRLAVRLGVSRIVAVGEEARPVHLAAAGDGRDGRSQWVADAAAAEDLLGAELAPDDVVLLKASNAVGLWRLAERLAAPSDGPGDRRPSRRVHPAPDPVTRS
jgi:UDP-N-acetylmuramoyl-tripeptide--D-alanyl-D-alanine ligase